MESAEMNKMFEAIEDAQGNETILDGIKIESDRIAAAQEFHNKRVALYSNLRYFNSVDDTYTAARIAEAIDHLEAEYYNQ